MKLKTKKITKKEIKALAKCVFAQQTTIEFLKSEKEKLETQLETFKGDAEFSNKLIFEIGFIVFGPNWQQKHSRNEIIDAVEQLKMQANLNGGMFEGMREAHRVVLDKLSTELRKQNFKEGV